jgi:uncharacterized membrane protein YeaQ/YmgE (transglycosylase-associated protein family)
MTTGNIVAWILIGAIVGILYALARQPRTGTMTLLDLIVGVVGGLVGGVLLNAVGGLVGAEIIGVSLAGGAVAIIGAVVLVALFEAVTRSPQQ